MDEIIMGKIFNKYSSLVLPVFLGVMLLIVGIAGAALQEADLFEKAYGYYLSYNPEKAIETFDQFLKQFPNSSALDSVMFWRAKSLIQLRKFDDAVRDLRFMKEHYPDSSYAAFAEKELESLQKTTPKVEQQDSSKERFLNQVDTKTSVYEEKISKLESETAIMEKKISDLEKVRQLTEKGLAKALEDKNSLEAQIEDARRVKESLEKKLALTEKNNMEHDRLIDEKKALEARLRDQEEKLKAASAQAELQKDRDKEMAALNTRLQEQEKKQKDYEGTIQQLTQERQQLEEQLGREKKRLAEATGKGSERETSLQNEVRQIEKERKDLLAKVDALKSERDDLAKRAAEGSSAAQDRKLAEADAQRLRGEADALQKKVKELETAAQEKKALEARLRDQEEKLKAASAQAELQKDRDKEMTALSAQMKNYERPFVRIGGEAYSVARLADESILAETVKRKLKASPGSWNRKNPLDTLILEEALYRRAQKANMSVKGDELNVLAREHGLSREEVQYLTKYLAIDSMYKRKVSELTAPSGDAKAYYEKNREQFVSRPAGKSVRILALAYTTHDELEKGVVALDLLQEVSSGKSFEEIARKRRGNVSFKEVPLDSLKGWVREKADLLKEGDLSPVISSGSEYVIMQIQKVKALYRPYEEVRNEIQKKLVPDSSEQSRLLELWLDDVYQEVEFTR